MNKRKSIITKFTNSINKLNIYYDLPWTIKNLNAISFHNICKTREVINLFPLSTFQSPRNGDDLSDGEPLETEERSHTPPPRMDSPEDNLTPQLKVKVNRINSKQ